MTASTKQITEAALKLPDRDRLRIATAIWKSFGASEDSVADLDALARYDPRTSVTQKVRLQLL